MRKLLLLAICLTMLSSCASQQFILKGSYPSPNQFAETDLPFEDVWNKVIDYFAINGVPIATIDKASGLIVSSKVSFMNDYTREGKNGKPINTKAYVVIGSVEESYDDYISDPVTEFGFTIVGDYNVRIKSEGRKTKINVNLMNLEFVNNIVFINDIRDADETMSPFPIKSTGVFQKKLIKLFR